MNGNAYSSEKRLKRMELEFKGISFVFDINPESYDEKISNRANVTYTKAGAFIDEFGEGIKEISISGTTGFKSITQNPEHGYNKFLQIKKIIEETINNVKDGEEITDFLKFYNHTDGIGYYTVPNRLGILRNVNQPLLYKYDLSFYIIRRIGEEAPTPNIERIGNPLKATDTTIETIDPSEVEETTDSGVSEDNKEKAKESLDKKEKKATLVGVSSYTELSTK